VEGLDGDDAGAEVAAAEHGFRQLPAFRRQLGEIGATAASRAAAASRSRCRSTAHTAASPSALSMANQTAT